jgi:hypothetical protein
MRGGKRLGIQSLQTPIARPAKYPSAIASTKQQTVVNCVSTILYRHIVPPATEASQLRLHLKPGPY